MQDRVERRILSDLREGRREAYEGLIDAHYGSVYRFLLLLTCERNAAEDLTQEVFTAAWRALDRFEGRASLGTWLHRIAYNTFVDAQRRADRRQGHAERVRAGESSPARDPVSELMAVEEVAWVRQGLEQLDVDDRTVLVLHYVQGLSYRETAAVLGQPIGTVKWLTKRALDRLRRQLTGKAQP